MDLDTALRVLAARHQAVVVTLKRDGRPQLSNVAYALAEDGIIRISITDGRAKTANLRRDPRASFYVTREDFWAYLVVEGDVELSAVASSPDDDVVGELEQLYRDVQGEHPDWNEFRQAMVGDKRIVARLRPTRAYGMWPE